jgi:hypothetical protein
MALKSAKDGIMKFSFGLEQGEMYDLKCANV